MVVFVISTTILSLILVVAAVVIIAQRVRIANHSRRHWEQEREIARLHEAVDSWASDYRRLDAANTRLLDRYEALASKPPLVIQPPDVASIVREVGDSIGTAIYGRQQEVSEALKDQMIKTSMVHEQPRPGEWFPEVEFDQQMGPMPTRGGWVNGQTNANMPPSPDQTPVHALDENGHLRRLDGTPLFQPGQSAPMPTGGVE